MSGPRPLVSVVVPAHDAELFLKETLESVLGQRYAPLEIIVVDDGSTDATREIAESYGEAVRCIHQANRGVAAARNRGLEASSGTYVCFLDADDWLYPEDLERKVTLLESDLDLALAHGLVEVTGPALEPTGVVMQGAAGYILADLLRFIPPAIPCPSNALIRRSVLEEVGSFDEALGTSADYDLWLRIASERRVGRVDGRSVKYRRHDAAMFGDVEAQVRDMRRIFRKHGERLGGHPDWRTLHWRFFRSVAGEYRRRGRWWAAAKYAGIGLWTRTAWR